MRYEDIKEYIKEAQSILDQGLFKLRVSKDGYPLLIRQYNEKLFQLLELAGLFKLHITNKGYVIGIHQVSLYLFQGYKHMLKGREYKKGEVDVHHLDHDKNNWNPNNLVYCSPDDNRIASEGCKRILGFGYYNGQAIKKESTLYNSNGDEITNHDEWLSNLVVRTANATLMSITKGKRIPKHLLIGMNKVIDLITNVYEYVASRCRRIEEGIRWSGFDVLRINWEALIYDSDIPIWD